jgi:hypothetical protein
LFFFFLLPLTASYQPPSQQSSIAIQSHHHPHPNTQSFSRTQSLSSNGATTSTQKPLRRGDISATLLLNQRTQRLRYKNET